MLTTTLSGKGQVVLPAEVRAKAGLLPGDRFAVSIEDGIIMFKPLPRDPLTALKGAFGGTDSLLAALLADRSEERARG